MKAKTQLGELLIARGLITREQLNKALRLQVSGKRRLGFLLIKMGIITDDQLLEVLAEQLELPIIDVNTEFKAEVRDLLPRYLCLEYSVLPLQREKDNILSLAMADPLDTEAISNVENYTGMVVKPNLTKQTNITQAITRYIPFTAKELFHFLTFNRAVKFVSAAAVVLLLVTSYFLVSYVYHEKYGTMSQSGDSVVYKNHDLMVGLDRSGKISLLGRAARSEGYYSVTFDKIEILKDFIDHKKNDFSDKQALWLQWIIKNRVEKNAAARG